MSNTRAFKIITHLSEAADLEEELFVEKDGEYDALYRQAFSIEDQYIGEMHPTKPDPHAKSELDKSAPPSRIKKGLLKLLYKKLAHKTHPDLCPNGGEEFQKIQEAFEKKDGAALLAAALKHDIEVTITEADIKAMMADISHRRRRIEDRKNTFRWAWGESNRDEKAKKYIRAALQIDEDKFQEWLAAKKSKG